ncbi:MAG: hypothetical protein J6H18_00315 [Lachnospiraceae bacterium]|nr:hypothetical protein [Lachnospiraceae bacterium]
MKKRDFFKCLIYLIFFLGLTGLGLSFFRGRSGASPKQEDLTPGLGYVAAQEAREAASVQARIRQVRREAESASALPVIPTEAPIVTEIPTEAPAEPSGEDPGDSSEAEILADLKAQIDSLNIRLFQSGEEGASWRKRFDNAVFTGDSMAQGLVSSGLFDTGHVKFKRGAALGHFDEEIQAAIDTLPDSFIFFTGCGNVSEYINDPSEFYRQYVQRIQWVKTALPDTEIYVICMLPASDYFIQHENYHVARQPEYDMWQKKACEDTGVHYVDCHWMVRQELYLTDGLHFGEAFYTILTQYLALVIGL